MTAVFRSAAAADAERLHALLQQMASEVGRSIAGDAATLRHHGFGPSPRFRAVLAEADGEAMGLALAFPEYSSWRSEVGLYVQDLYLVPSARGRGNARGLLAAVWAAARDWNPAYLTLMVDHRNAAGRDWYRRQGFALRERGDLLVLDGQDLASLCASAAP